MANPQRWSPIEAEHRFREAVLGLLSDIRDELRRLNAQDAPPEYVCDRCGRTFASPQALGGHKGRCKGERA